MQTTQTSLTTSVDLQTQFFCQQTLDFRSTSPEGKIRYIWYTTLSLAYTPIRVLKSLHGWIGRMVLRKAIAKYSKNVDLEDVKKNLQSTKIWKNLTQYTIKIDEAEINAFALTHNQPKDERWLLVSNGLGGRAVNRLEDTTDLADSFKSNMFVFDYPGTGESNGLPRRSTLMKTYQTALTILQTHLQAQQLVLYGHSFGGGVQAEALQNYTFPKGYPVIAIKSRTFSSMTAATNWMVQTNSKEYLQKSRFHRVANKASALLGRITQLCILLIGWNIKTAEASRNLHIPEIILYSASKNKENPDGIIPEKATLPVGLGTPKTTSTKVLLAIPEAHNDEFQASTLQTLADKVNELFSNSSAPKST